MRSYSTLITPVMLSLFLSTAPFSHAHAGLSSKLDSAKTAVKEKAKSTKETIKSLTDPLTKKMKNGSKSIYDVLKGKKETVSLFLKNRSPDIVRKQFVVLERELRKQGAKGLEALKFLRKHRATIEDTIIYTLKAGGIIATVSVAALVSVGVIPFGFPAVIAGLFVTVYIPGIIVALETAFELDQLASKVNAGRKEIKAERKKEKNK